MIKSPRTHTNKLLNIYKNFNPCDTVDFTQNLKMCTSQGYCFGKTQQIQKIMKQDKIKFDKQMDMNIKYIEKQVRDTSSGKMNYKFKQFQYEISDADECQNGQRDPYISSTLINNRTQKQINSRFFDFAKLNEKYIQQKTIQEKTVKPQMQLKDINAIGTSQFVQKCCNYEYFDEIMTIIKPVPVKQHYDRDLIDQMKKYKQFKIFECKQGIIGMSKDRFSIDILNGIKIHKYQNRKLFMPQTLQQHSINKDHILSLSRFGYRSDELLTHLVVKQEIRRKELIVETEADIENQIYNIKKDILILKQKIKKKHNTHFRDHQTQTQKIITFQYIKDLISVEDSALLSKIAELVEIKQNQIKQELNHQVIYKRIHPLINKSLFELLILIASGETFISWSDFMMMNDSSQVEKILLDKIYAHITEIEGKLCTNGSSKIQLLSYYCKIKFMISEEGGQIFNKPNQTTQIKEITRKKTKRLETTYTKDGSKSISKSPSFAIKSNKNLVSFLKSTQNLNGTTKQNTTNFNRTKNTTQGQNFQKRIDNLFQFSPIGKKTIRVPSKSPVKLKNVTMQNLKKTNNSFSKASLKNTISKNRFI